MNKLLDLEAINGDCFINFNQLRKIELIITEDFSTEFIKKKQHASVWIPTNTKAFWMMIKKVANKNIEADGLNSKKELKELSIIIDKLIDQF